MNAVKRKPVDETQANPFEEKWTVLAGTARKRAIRDAAASRSRRNVFADRRIAENDPTLPEEDRYLARLQRERTRRTRNKARFSLANPEGEDANQADSSAPAFSLLRDDYDDTQEGAGIDSEDDAKDSPDGGVDAREDGSDDELLTVKQPAENEDETRAERTHKEIMDEVVLKSKMYKAQRQEQKHDVEEQTAKLDKELPDIMALLSKSEKDYERKLAKHSRLVPSPANASIFNEDENSASCETEGGVKGVQMVRGVKRNAFHYEKVYQQLAAEKRARPSNRMPTEEEKAEKDLEELRELEQNRIKRMQSADSEDEGDYDQQNQTKRKRKIGERSKRAGGDDLDDGFNIPDGEEDSQSEDSGSGEFGYEGEAERHLSTPQYSEAMAQEKLKASLDPDTLLYRQPHRANDLDSNIPFVFKRCPSNEEELQVLFEDRSVEERSTIIERIRKCFAVSLNPTANPARLDALLSCLLERIVSLSKVTVEKLEGATQELQMLLVHVYTLGRNKEDLVASWARGLVTDAFTKLTNGKGREQGLSSRWKASTLIMLRVVGQLFPASDVRHPLTTPLVLLLSEALELRRFRCLEDIAVGIVVSSILIEQMVEAGRFSGQLSTFLTSVVQGAFGEREVLLSGLFKELRECDKNSLGDSFQQRLKVSDCVKTSRTRDDLIALQCKVVHVALWLIDASAFEGKTKHMDIIYKRLPVDLLPESNIRSRLEQILGKAAESRKALTLYAKALDSVEARMLNPRFSAEGGVFHKQPRTSYTARQQGDLSASAARIRRALRKEERGMARDVRRRASHAAQEKARVDADRHALREKRGREVTAFLEEQQASWKRAEKRQKMLSGKKW